MADLRRADKSFDAALDYGLVCPYNRGGVEAGGRSALESAVSRRGRVRKRGTILGVMSAGHGVAHLYDQGVPVMMPTIASHFGLTTFQVTVLQALRFTGFGVVNIGGGLVVDMLKRHWGMMLTCCMLSAALFFALLGMAPGYVALVLIVPLVSIPGALWHLPSAASLSQIFSDRRGWAISIHGFGANLGNLAGPVIATRLLALLGSWRGVMFVYVAPALVMTVFVWVFLRHVGRIGSVERRDLSTQIRASLGLARNPAVVLMVSAATLRGIGLDALFAWSPFYLEETLGKGTTDAGFNFALLTGMGIVSTPILGYLSDRFGRKAVIVPGFAVAAALSLATVAAGGGWMLSLVMAGTGLFSFALHQIVQAAVLDEVGEGREATAVGLIFGLNGILGAVSPFLAFLVIDNFGGYGAVYYYAGILTAAGGVLAVLAPTGRKPPASVR